MTLLVFAFVFGWVSLASGVTNTKVVHVEEILPLDSTVKKVNSTLNSFVSEWGTLKHVTSGKYVYSDVTPCTEYNSGLRIGHNRTEALEVRFARNGGHVGFLETRCGWLVQAERGQPFPSVDSPMELSVHNYQEGARFAIDEENSRIEHRGKLHLYPFGGSENPDEGTVLVLNDDLQDASNFQFMPNEGPVGLFPKPELSGEWFTLKELVVSEPGASYPYEQYYNIGRSVSAQATPVQSWRPSRCTAYNWFRESDYNYYACHAEPATWDYQINRTFVFEATYGMNIVQQYTLYASQYNEGLRFRTNFIQVLKAKDASPVIPPHTRDFC